MKAKKTTRLTFAGVVGAVPEAYGPNALWKVRLVAPFFPFFLDSRMKYLTKKEADGVADMWRKRKVTIEFSKAGK